MASENSKRKVLGGRFYVGSKLGSGLQADVFIGTEISSGQEFALKIINKHNIKPKAMQSLDREINIMKSLQHPNILGLRDVDMSLMWEGRNVAMLVLELAEGGELFDYLMYSGYFDDVVARTYFHQLLDALSACHAINTYHRDLKPENLLLSGNFQLKLSDFGLSNMTESDEAVLQTECGTKSYMAPEIISHQAYSGAAVDIWSAGVVLFIMLCGNPPFDIAARTDWWFNAISMNRYDRFWAAHLRAAAHMRTNAVAQNFVNGLLRPNPTDRPTIGQIKEYEWFNLPVLSDSDLYKTMYGKQCLVQQAKNAELQASRSIAQNKQGNAVDPFSRNTCRSMSSPPPCDAIVANKPTTVYTSMNAEDILSIVRSNAAAVSQSVEFDFVNHYAMKVCLILSGKMDEFDGEMMVCKDSTVSFSVFVYSANSSSDIDGFAVSFIREDGDLFEFYKILRHMKNGLLTRNVCLCEKEELLESSMSMI